MSKKAGILRIVNEHSHLIGQICKLTKMGVEIEKEYLELFGIGNTYKAEQVHFYCYNFSGDEMNLMFIDEKPFKIGELTWYCLKEIGAGANGDWHWFTLNQIIICN